jgi:hypothetical protein
MTSTAQFLKESQVKESEKGMNERMKKQLSESDIKSATTLSNGNKKRLKQVGETKVFNNFFSHDN